MLVAGTFTGCKNPNVSAEESSSDQNISVGEQESMPEVTWETKEKEGDEVTENVDNTIFLKENEIALEKESDDVQIEKEKVTITKPGTYEIKGSISDGQIVVDTNEEENVKIILNGVKITNSKTSPIQIISAPKKVILHNQKNCVNIIEDGKEYEEEDEASAAIYAKDDLKISGEGTMYISGNYKKGIQSKDDLTIKNATVFVKSEDDAIRGKDSLTIEKAYIYVDSKADGLRTTNETDEGKGDVQITGSELYITSKQDGIQAARDLSIENTKSVICAGEEQREADNSQKPEKGEMPEKGEKPEKAEMPEKGEKPEDGEMPGEVQRPEGFSERENENTNEKSSNGMKATGNLTVTGGNHSIVRSYEGLEGEVVHIKDGTIRITASDDGINAASDSENVTPMIQMDSGYVLIEASGDGLDSNGDIVVNGGKLVVYGPVRDADGALDYDGQMTAGKEATILAVGSSGMAQGITAKENGSLEFTCDVSSEEIMSIQDEEGNVIITFAAPKEYSCVMFTSPEITEGKDYNIYTGGENSGETQDGIYTGGQYKGGSALGTLGAK